MIPNKPYLIRALHEWITDNNWTPYILVNTLISGCQVPEAYVKDGSIVFNITYDVVENLILGNEAIEFIARFSGVPAPIYLPVSSITAIYAKENGEGMAFPKETNEDDKNSPSLQKAKGKPDLRIVE